MNACSTKERIDKYRMCILILLCLKLWKYHECFYLLFFSMKPRILLLASVLILSSSANAFKFADEVPDGSDEGETLAKVEAAEEPLVPVDDAVNFGETINDDKEGEPAREARKIGGNYDNNSAESSFRGTREYLHFLLLFVLQLVQPQLTTSCFFSGIFFCCLYTYVCT